jgi:hypothetical protein
MGKMETHLTRGRLKATSRELTKAPLRPLLSEVVSLREGEMFSGQLRITE